MANDLAALLPASVTVTFPEEVNGVPTSAPYTITVLLSSLGLQELAGISGHSGTHVLQSTDLAVATTSGGTPTNLAELQALANQMATDWYRWQLGRLTIKYGGIVPYVSDGFSDLEFLVWEPEVSTRVERYEWEDEPYYAYGSEGSGPVVPPSNCCSSIITNTSVTNSAVTSLTVGVYNTTPASVTTGFGSSVNLTLTDTVGPVMAASIVTTWTTATSGSQSSQLAFNVYNVTTPVVGLYITQSGGAPTVTVPNGVFTVTKGGTAYLTLDSTQTVATITTNNAVENWQKGGTSYVTFDSTQTTPTVTEEDDIHVWQKSGFKKIVFDSSQSTFTATNSDTIEKWQKGGTAYTTFDSTQTVATITKNDTVDTWQKSGVSVVTFDSSQTNFTITKNNTIDIWEKGATVAITFDSSQTNFTVTKNNTIDLWQKGGTSYVTFDSSQTNFTATFTGTVVNFQNAANTSTFTYDLTNTPVTNIGINCQTVLRNTGNTASFTYDLTTTPVTRVSINTQETLRNSANSSQRVADMTLTNPVIRDNNVIRRFQASSTTFFEIDPTVTPQPTVTVGPIGIFVQQYVGPAPSAQVVLSSMVETVDDTVGDPGVFSSVRDSAGTLQTTNMPVTPPTDGQLLIGVTSKGGYVVGGLTAGTGISVTPGAGTITIAATGGSGSPGGSNTDVQYNASGSFAGEGYFTYGGNGTLDLSTPGGGAASFWGTGGAIALTITNGNYTANLADTSGSRAGHFNDNTNSTQMSDGIWAINVLSGPINLGANMTVNSVPYSWPGSQGSANTFIQNDGSGNLSWASGGGLAIGDSISGGTAARILFEGTGPVLADSGNFIIDLSTGQVSVTSTSAVYTALLAANGGTQIGAFWGGDGGRGFVACDGTNAISITGGPLLFSTSTWPGSPADGDLGYDGTHLYFHQGSNTIDLLNNTSLVIGTTPLSSGTANCVLFENASHILSENAALTFDSSTGFFVVAGNTSPGFTFSATLNYMNAAALMTDGTNTVKLADTNYAVDATAGSIAVVGTMFNTFEWNNNTSSPSTVYTVGALPLQVYGRGTPNYVLTDPDAWILIGAAGGTYKVPCYLP